MAATTINGLETSNIRIDILADDRPGIGVKSGADVAAILRALADKFEAGKKPMCWNEDSVPGASVDWH